MLLLVLKNIYLFIQELVNDWEAFRVSIGHLLNSAAVSPWPYFQSYNQVEP